MGNILRQALEDRRAILINRLLALNVYKSEEQLKEWSLTELESEFKKIKSDCHPHSEMGSIHWSH